MRTYIHIHNTIHMHAHKQHTTRTHMYAHVSVSLFNLKRCYLQFASNTRFYFVFFFFLHCHELSSFAFLVQWGRVTNRSYNLSQNRNKIVEKSNNSSKCLLHALKTHTQAHTHMHTKCNGGNCRLWLGIFFFCILFVVWVRVVLPFKNSRSCSADIFL